MSQTKIPPMPSGLMPKLTYKDAERLNRCIELLDACDQALRQNRNSTQVAVCRLLFEAQKPIVEIRDKVFAAMQRWSRRFGVDLAAELAESDPPDDASPADPADGESSE